MSNTNDNTFLTRGLFLLILACLNSCGGGTSANDEVAGPPPAPSQLSAEAVQSSMAILNWTSHGALEDGFVVEKRGESGEWVVLGRTLENQTSMADFPLKADSEYEYRVRAFNGSGQSRPSNTAVVTTPKAAWSRSLSAEGSDQFTSILPDPSGGSFLVGTTDSMGAGGEDVWVVRLNKEGDVLWQKSFGGDGDDRACGASRGESGEVYVVANSNSFGDGDTDIWLLELDPSGGISRQRTYGGSENDSASGIVALSGDSLMIFGHTRSFGVDGRDGFAFQLNAHREIDFARTIGAPGNQSIDGFAVRNGNLVFAGQNSNGVNGSDVWAMTMNSSFQKKWTGSMDIGSLDEISAIQPFGDGSLAIVGSTNIGGNTRCIWISRMSSSDLTIWTNLYAFSDSAMLVSARGVKPYLGDLLICGTMERANVDGLVFRVGVQGDVKWGVQYDSNSDHVLWDVAVTGESLSVAGARFGEEDFENGWLVRTEAKGFAEFTPDSGLKAVDAPIYPVANPFTFQNTQLGVFNPTVQETATTAIVTETVMVVEKQTEI